MMSYKMRQEFEAWCESECGFTPTRSSEHAGYNKTGVNGMWFVWQASRSKICVELPHQWYDARVDGDLMDAEQVMLSLEAAGVSFK